MVFPKNLAPTNDHPLGIEIAKAEGIFIWDNTGKKYFDMISGLAVNNIGHRHPRILEAIQIQMNQYLHVMPYGEFIQGPQNELAVKLSTILPEELNCSYFVNSGAEAVEGALKLAKRVTGRSEILAFKNSYHGSTHGALSATGNESRKNAFRPLLPDVNFLHFNLPEDLTLITEKTAAVIIEPVQGDAGVRIPDKTYMQELRKKCDEKGCMLILDEIQTGLGRTGKWFAFQHFDIVPDILTLAKALGGGMPIGAFISSKKFMNSLSHHPMLGHITTFGGHPVNCAAALANLNVLESGNWIDECEAKGKLLSQAISHPSIIEIRQIGLMLAVEFPNEIWVEKIVKRCLDKGVITFWFLSCKNSFRLAPPLSISDSEINQVAAIIKECIEFVSKGIEDANEIRNN